MNAEAQRYRSDMQCMACGEWFTGETAFVKHRTGTYTQIGPDYGRTCDTDGLELNSRGVWAGKSGGQWWQKGRSDDGDVGQTGEFDAEQGDECGVVENEA